MARGHFHEGTLSQGERGMEARGGRRLLDGHCSCGEHLLPEELCLSDKRLLPDEHYPSGAGKYFLNKC